MREKVADTAKKRADEAIRLEDVRQRHALSIMSADGKKTYRVDSLA
jgi:hypothetical protein